jgi:hypothetical protein
MLPTASIFCDVSYERALLRFLSFIGVDPDELLLKKIGYGVHPDVFSFSELTFDMLGGFLRRISGTPVEFPRKLVLLKGPFSFALQNALLKTLEEPPKNTHLVLYGVGSEHYLETVLSRCFVFEDVTSSNTHFRVDDLARAKELRRSIRDKNLSPLLYGAENECSIESLYILYPDQRRMISNYSPLMSRGRDLSRLLILLELS